MMYNNNHFKVRSRKLKELGFQNAQAFYASETWANKKLDYASRFPAFCSICLKPADDLHHKTYKNMGSEADEDLQWLCRSHHAEAHQRGRVGRPTAAMKTILQGHGCTDEDLSRLSFGDAFQLIEGISHGTITTPQVRK